MVILTAEGEQDLPAVCFGGLVFKKYRRIDIEKVIIDNDAVIAYNPQRINYNVAVE